MIGRCLVWAAALLLAGCTILNDPDRSLIPRDGGTSDGDTSDAGPMPDGGDGSVPVDAGDGGCVPRQELCGNGIDDDCDTIADCDDLDCAGLAACCRDDVGDVLFTEDWSSADLSVRWSAEPSGEASYPRKEMRGSQWRLVDFTEGDAIILNDCTPVSLGIDLGVSFFVTTAGTCTEPDCHAALYFTQSEYLAPGSTLFDDLVISVDAEGELVVRDHDDELGSAVFGAGRVDVQVGLQPGVDDLGEPQMLATVHAVSGGVTTTVVDGVPFIHQSDLVSSIPDCDDAPGLFLALAGKGDRVEVGTLEPRRQECVNPSQFLPPSADSAILTSDRLGLSGWAGPGIGAPTLTSTLNGGMVRWDVLVDATNVDRQLEKITHVGMSLGHSRSLNWDAFPWTSWPGSPRAGANPPGCTDGSCDANVSLREPSLLAFTNTSGELGSFLVAYARESDDALASGLRDVYELRIQGITPDVTAGFSPAAAQVVAPADVPGCDSLRDPELIPAGPARADGYWLFFTCGNAGETAIHAIRLEDITYAPVPGSHRPILLPADVAPYGAGGIGSPAVIAAYQDPADGRGAAYRMWFLAQERGGSDVTVAMAQAQSAELTAADPIPSFRPYPANPVLIPQAVSGCGAGSCTLTGLDVVRRANDDTTLRFLVARRVNAGGTGALYELVPMEQFWRNPWR